MSLDKLFFQVNLFICQPLFFYNYRKFIITDKFFTHIMIDQEEQKEEAQNQEEKIFQIEYDDISKQQDRDDLQLFQNALELRMLDRQNQKIKFCQYKDNQLFLHTLHSIASTSYMDKQNRILYQVNTKQISNNMKTISITLGKETYQLNSKNTFIRQNETDAINYLEQLLNPNKKYQLEQMEFVIIKTCSIDSKQFNFFLKQILPEMENLKFLSFRMNQIQEIEIDTDLLTKTLKQLKYFRFLDFGNEDIHGNRLNQNAINFLKIAKQEFKDIIFNFP